MENNMLSGFELIEKEIFDEVHRKGIRDTLIPFKRSGSSGSFESCKEIANDNSKLLTNLECHKDIYAWRLLKSSHVLIGNLIVFIKKIIRKLIKWYIEPIVDEQRVFNNDVTNLLRAVLSENNTLHQRIEDMQRSLNNGVCEEKDNGSHDGTYSISYASCGEDVILADLLKKKGIELNKCKYLDIGAESTDGPRNTKLLYKKGATGVLVGYSPEQCRQRTRDKRRAKTEFVENYAAEIREHFGSDLFIVYVCKEEMNMFLLENILTQINRPYVLMVDIYDSVHELLSDGQSEIIMYIKKAGYYQYANTGCTVMFVDERAE